MTESRSVLDRLRTSSVWPAGVRAIHLGSHRWSIAGWICACFVLVAVLGTLQFRWIGQVSDSQRTAAVVTLRGPMRGAIEQFQDEVELLLWMFRPDADYDPSSRVQTYWQCYLSWHALSKHGPAVKRILFYDTPSRGTGELTELLSEPRSIKRADWDKDLAPVRSHIHENGFTPGSLLSRRWAVTWMFAPGAVALYRPITMPEPGRPNAFNNARLTGYLILKLDVDFISDTLIPEILSDQFRRLNKRARYLTKIVLDERSLYVYEPSLEERVPPKNAPKGFTRYVLRPSSQSLSARDSAEDADVVLRFPLFENRVPESAKQFGVVQRVALRNRVDGWRMSDPRRIPPGLELDAGLSSTIQDNGPRSTVRWSSHFPRLFLAAPAPHSVSLWAGRQEVSQAEAINTSYKRSVAMGIVVLVLLVGAMAMVAISQRNAARMAAMRIEAAASQSHQLRNPLAGISLLADNMVRGALGPGEKTIEYGETIRAYGRRLNEIVDRTARLAAMDSPTSPYRLATLDVTEVARDALEEARPVTDGAGFAAECSLADGLPTIRADPQALRQCVGELLSNAVKYGLPGRWVKIETEASSTGRSRDVRIRVRDRGRGIPPDEARKIFEPFYRAAGIAQSTIAGSGLGLALARSAVEGMGGKLTLESEVGRGSVFTIRFPVP